MNSIKDNDIELVIHIGVHKTATSSIQSFFLKNRIALLKKSILYPESGCDYGNGHHAIARFYKKKCFESVKKSFSNIKNEAISNSVDKVLISSEQFSLIN